ncbi:S41 family peptidase [Deinococcus misasensis]|uniref:S41 family peptidase n=1 Tax=Deinococcus misasensis TaxID=392413 RepID=UPI001470428D|nr:S41 family peptidase [Deinococcus misasensis]
MKWTLWMAILLGMLGTVQAQRYPSSNAARLYSSFQTAMLNYYGEDMGKVPGLLKKYASLTEQTCEKQKRCQSSDAEKQIRALLSELGDAHTDLYGYRSAWDESLGNSLQSLLENELGVYLTRKEGHWYVKFVMYGGEGDVNGLRQGDEILAAGGLDLERQDFVWKLDLQERPQVLVDRQGKRLKITLSKKAQKEYWQKATYKIQQDVAILQIPTFYSEPGRFEKQKAQLPISESVHQAVRELQEKGVDQLVLDLRYNGGGWMDECAASSSAFVKTFKVYQDTKFTSGFMRVQKGQVLTYDRSKVLKGIPFPIRRTAVQKPAFWNPEVVVLVNEDTASCGEWFTYQLQRNGRARVIGTPTFGIMNTSTQSQSLGAFYTLQITMLRSLHEDFSLYPKRITPDQVVQNTLIEDLQLQSALASFEQQQKPSLPLQNPLSAQSP